VVPERPKRALKSVKQNRMANGIKCTRKSENRRWCTALSKKVLKATEFETSTTFVAHTICKIWTLRSAFVTDQQIAQLMVMIIIIVYVRLQRTLAVNVF